MPLRALPQPLRRRLPLLTFALLFSVMATFACLAYRQLAAALVANAGERVSRVTEQLAASLQSAEGQMLKDVRRAQADSALCAYATRPTAVTLARAQAALDAYRREVPELIAVELWVGGTRRLSSSPRTAGSAEGDGVVVTSIFPHGRRVGPFIARGDTVLTEVRLPILTPLGDTAGILRQLDRLSDGRGARLVRGLIGEEAVFLVGNRDGGVWTDMTRPVPPPFASPGVRGVREITAPDGSRWIGSTAEVQHSFWTVWVAVPRESVVAPAGALLRSITMLGLLLLALGSAAAWLIAGRLLRPLVDMTNAAERIAGGDYTQRMALGRTDEVGRLAAAFDMMSANIASVTDDLAAKHLELARGNQELTEAKSRADRHAANLGSMVEAAPTGICTLDPEGRVLSWNLAAERMFGWSTPEVLGRMLPIVSPAQRPEFDELRRVVLGGAAFHNRLIVRQRRDGTPIHLSVSATPLRDDTGAVVAMLALFDNVTERIATEAQLVNERRFLRQVIDSNPHLIFAKDLDGRFTLVNQAVADAYGTTIEALIGKSDSDFNGDATEVAAFLAADREVITTGRTRVIPEERVTTVDGAVRWFQTVKRPIVGADGRAGQVLGVSTDITERKLLAAQLLQSQKMDAVGQLAGGVAHDFNNVLAAIKGFAELIAFELEEDSPIRADVGEISAAADRAAALTQQLLAFSRRQLLQPVLVSQNAVAEGMNKMLLRLMGAEVQCELRLDPALAPVLADRGQLEQVLMNLVVNARDSMPGGGTVTIATANVSIDAARALQLGGVDAVPPGEYVLLSVTDTGIGMDRITQSRIFEPFFTTKPTGMGTGLGLSTVYGIVRQSGGYVTVWSELARGTRIAVYLPRAEGTVAQPAPARAPVPARTAAETVLVVDDDASVLATGARMLSRAGYDVMSASSPEEAERLARSYRDTIHLLVTDVMMPRMNGGELARRMRLGRPDIRVLYTSGYTNDAVVGRGFITPDTVFLAKPYTMNDLVAKVREALGR